MSNDIKHENDTFEQDYNKMYAKGSWSAEELEMTKKCLLNKWSFPPMEFLEKRYQDQKALEPKNEQDKNEESDDDMI